MELTQPGKPESSDYGSNVLVKIVGDARDKALSPTEPRIVFLDTLRFIAAAAVVFQHVIEIDGPLGAAIAGALSPGVFGVVLFFIISGFVIPMTAKKKLDLRKFVLRRIFRIYPLVLVTFALIAVAANSGMLPSLDWIREASLRVWLANIFLAQDYVGAAPLWGVTWTLSLEVAWYTVFALALIVLGPRFDDWLVVIAPALLLSLVLLSLATGYRLPLARLGMIYAAILGTRSYRHQTGGVSLHRMLIDFGIFVVVMAISNVVAFGYFRHQNITMNQALYPWLAAPCLFALVTLVPRVRQTWLVNSRLITWLGAISFSIYLLHPLAIIVAHDYARPSSAMGVSLGLTLGFSILGYYLVEIPGQRLGRWICDALPKPARVSLKIRA